MLTFAWVCKIPKLWLDTNEYILMLTKININMYAKELNEVILIDDL